MNNIITNNGKLKIIPFESRKKEIRLSWGGFTGSIITRKFPGSYRISVTPDLRVKFQGWPASDPMTIEELGKLFNHIGLVFMPVQQ